MKQYYVYILKCNDGTYYTGFTSNLEERIQNHNSGKYKDAYTFKRRPVLLVFYESFFEPNQAIMFEKQIKKWSKSKKEALISGEFDRLQALAECRNATHSKYKPNNG
ncbi:GIY-YIG nuclease family protein [Formosa agariphila]|nr:GIY-YIG nuclease family protein [Formosa agariphila]